VTWEARSANALRLRVTLDRPGLLVISQTYYPGWQAAVDGQPVQLWRADAVLSGVYLEAGEHQVTLAYRPPLLWLGIGLTLAGIGACLGLLMWPRPGPRA
jgi:uncharacterized membrane protein YfhO